MRYIVRTVAWKPERAANVDVMRESIPQLESIVDTTGDEQGTLGRALIALGESGGVMLEDDVQLCRHFTTRIERVIAERGCDDVITFFESPKRALPTAYVGGSTFFWSQCIYIPPRLGPIMWNEVKHLKRGSDVMISRALVALKRKYWRVRPHIVQHLPFESALTHRPRNRQTQFFIDDLYPDLGEHDAYPYH